MKSSVGFPLMDPPEQIFWVVQGAMVGGRGEFPVMQAEAARAMLDPAPRVPEHLQDTQVSCGVYKPACFLRCMEHIHRREQATAFHGDLGPTSCISFSLYTRSQSPGLSCA